MAVAWCRDTGIFEKFLDDRLPNSAKLKEPFENTNEPLTITQILPFMAIFGVGMVASIIALMGEKVANKAPLIQKQGKGSPQVPHTKDEIEITEVVI